MVVFIIFFSCRILSPVETKSKAQLSLELSIERQKNEMLRKKLKETTRILKSYELCKTPGKIKIILFLKSHHLHLYLTS